MPTVWEVACGWCLWNRKQKAWERLINITPASSVWCFVVPGLSVSSPTYTHIRYTHTDLLRKTLFVLLNRLIRSAEVYQLWPCMSFLVRVCVCVCVQVPGGWLGRVLAASRPAQTPSETDLWVRCAAWRPTENGKKPSELINFKHKKKRI